MDIKKVGTCQVPYEEAEDTLHEMVDFIKARVESVAVHLALAVFSVIFGGLNIRSSARKFLIT